jgi:hypothetical protein
MLQEETVVALVLVFLGAIMMTFGKDEDNVALSMGLILILLGLSVLAILFVF